ncbi:MAG TPA: hypothetical protein PK625_07900 [Spirochaetales bacterium]|nr:hypothetical protein [Spirochaetales bacterium]
MKLRDPVVQTVIRTLYRSLGMELSIRMAKSLIEGYNLNQRMGFPPSVPVPVQDAVKRIVEDLLDAGLMLETIEWLIQVDRHGYMGKQYPIVGIDDILAGMEEVGYTLDPESELFYEDARRFRTPGWGRLREGVEYPITLLRLDIARNSRLVRANASCDVESAYEALRDIVRRLVEKRRGRLWSWEGDGGLAAFHYGHPNISAVLSGVDIMNELLLYNLVDNPLDKPIQVRLAAHAGYLRYTEHQSELLRTELVRETTEIEERYTPPETFSVSATIAPHVDEIIKKCFVHLDSECPWEILSYSIKPRPLTGRQGRGKAASWK